MTMTMNGMRESVMKEKMPEEPARVDVEKAPTQGVVARFVVVRDDGAALVLRAIDGRPFPEHVDGVPVGPSFEREGEMATFQVQGLASPVASGGMGSAPTLFTKRQAEAWIKHLGVGTMKDRTEVAAVWSGATLSKGQVR